MERDDVDESRICLSIKKHGVFQDGGDTLKNIINKDVVTPQNQQSLLGAEHLGQAQMKVFVDKRLCEPPDSDQHFSHPFERTKPKHLPLCMKSCNFPRTSKTSSKWTGRFYKGSSQLTEQVAR